MHTSVRAHTASHALLNAKQHQQNIAPNYIDASRTKVVQLSKSLGKMWNGREKKVQTYRCRGKRTTAVIGFELSGKSLIVECY